MPPKKEKPSQRQAGSTHGHIEGAGVVVEQPITQTLTENYMPYAMSVIVSRAIPEIDGFKPSHRKILYTMYKMGLLSGSRTKSANVVGQTMRLNPHGDAAIYETMVRLTRGYEALISPYVDSKGNMGKVYSRDMAYAAARYTEVKLETICAELFTDIDKDTVDFVDNYDSTMKEPLLLPVRFPSILVNANVGIAVGMASSICSFNLAEVCRTAAAYIKNPKHDIPSTLQAPDFPGGGHIVYDAAELAKIYETGRGSVRVRSSYRYDKSCNCIEITEIPPTTTLEAIIDKVVELVKSGKIREIADIRDETDINGLKIAIDLKRGADPEKLMLRLFKSTPLEDTFSCNFNLLVGGGPQVLGVAAILEEWVAYRRECIRRRLCYELEQKRQKLHLLRGLEKILLDIDKAITIVRQTEQEREVVPNLMIGFGIDQIQAEYVAEIRLRHLNREYIVGRTNEIAQLLKDIAEMEAILESKKRLDGIIVEELEQVAKKYGKPRRTQLLYNAAQAEEEQAQEIPEYAVHLFFTREGYFKKITPLSLRMSGEQKLKEGDEITQTVESQNTAHLLFFTDKAQVYKCRASDFEDTKASVLGEYVAARLGFDENETPLYMAVTQEYSGFMLFCYENGKVAKVEMSAYQTKTNRRKLLGASCEKQKLVAALYCTEECEILLTSSAGRMLIFNTATLAAKTTKNTQGVAVLSMRGGVRLAAAVVLQPGSLPADHRYRTKTLPAAGALPRAEDISEQLTFDKKEESDAQ